LGRIFQSDNVFKHFRRPRLRRGGHEQIVAKASDRPVDGDDPLRAVRRGADLDAL
jgi:hypothetical protein